ncbi:hypothetical protein [Cupriavidus basilensis]|uniref:hypothetical protein n=1 Tax=Cupriavidus basilensis TaxID=68895 RepID=UPI001185593E|nr:hypothetical protein [Cupriavidus basilensis]
MTELLKAVQPERVLFTTFTLSLNWFESFCLPVLKMEGCDQIDLFVDSREACKLGNETSSAYAGNAYRVVPIYNKGGFFHPKIAYLQGEETDTLVVGSGNLTFPGQGGNLEVIDAVSARQHPYVFEEFASFAEALAQRPDLASETVSVLQHYAQRARHVASLAPAEGRTSPRTAWLVHTLATSAQDQLEKLVKSELGAVRRLTVLSPFHTRSGKAIASIANMCRAEAVRIGLQVERGTSRLLAPFDIAAPCLPENLTYVTPDTSHAARHVHAKCFELEGPSEYLVMTGSVNATWQSLCDTRNVEVALVRKLATSPFAWIAGEPAEFVPCEYEVDPSSALASSLQVSLRDDMLDGALSPNADVRVARLEVWSKSKKELTLEGVELDAEGRFSVAVTLNCATDRALRLKLIADNVRAVGWLNVESELVIPPGDKVLGRIAAKVVAGTATPADLRKVYERFRRILRREKERAQSAAQVYRTTSTRPLTAPTSPGPRSYDRWSHGDRGDLGQSPETAQQALAAAFVSLREARGAPSRTSARQSSAGQAKTSTQNTPTAAPPNDNPPSKGPKNKEAKNPMAEMLKTLPVVLAIDASGLWMPALIALSAGDLLARITADKALTLEEAATYIRRWLSDYSHFSYSAESRSRLMQLFCGMAATAAYFSGASADLSRLIQDVEVLAQRKVNADEWLDLVDQALQTDAFDTLQADICTQVLEKSLELGVTQARGRELETVIASVCSTEPCLDEPLKRYENIRKHLTQIHKSQLRTGKTRRLFGVIGPDVSPINEETGCPACNHKLGSVDVVAIIARDGVALHAPGCNKPVFSGPTKESLTAAHVPTSLYGYLTA